MLLGVIRMSLTLDASINNSSDLGLTLKASMNNTRDLGLVRCALTEDKLPADTGAIYSSRIEMTTENSP